MEETRKMEWNLLLLRQIVQILLLILQILRVVASLHES
jgi:hypothetical protein